jgi:hypothetical protein
MLFRFQSLIGSLLESCKPLLKLCDGLQIWAGRRKPASSASEVSIPNREYELLRLVAAVPMSTHFYHRSKYRFNSLNGLPRLNFINKVLLSRHWCQSSSTETEIRCDRCLSMHNALMGTVHFCHRSKYRFNTLNGLPMLNYINKVLSSKHWCQSSSTETEIRCDRCLSMHNALTATVWFFPTLAT